MMMLKFTYQRVRDEMKFSMNGFRRQLSNNVDDLKKITETMLKDEWFDKDSFVDAVNELITNSNVINCVFCDENPDFNEMSDLEVEHLEWTE
jgi:hypothetical protein